MEVAKASATMKAVNFPAISTIPRATVSTTLAAPWPQNKLNMLTLYASNPSTRLSSLSVTRCYSKPNTDTNNETDQNSTFESNPDQNTQSRAKPTSNEAISSSSTPSSSLSRGLVFDLGSGESWDCKEIGSPVVKRFLSDEEERWYMWYHGVSNENPSSDSIGLAISSNGVHWERGKSAVKSSADVGLVMNCGNDWWAFDTESIRPGEVVIMSSAKVRASSAVYWLFYTGYSSEKVNFPDDSSGYNVQNHPRVDYDGEGSRTGQIFRSLPGLAISQDGRHWARIEGEHHSGALLDVGSEGEWDSLFVASPKVVFHGKGDLRMYYHSFDVKTGEFCIGIARSRDGMKWIKLGKIMGGGKPGCFDELGAMNPRVVKNKKDGKYVMAYEGVNADGKGSIGLAVSTDGLKDWRRIQDDAVLKPGMADEWDSKGVGSPCLVEMDGEFDEWRLYYRGFGDGERSGIGMAVSDGNDLTKFRRWTGFQV